MRINPSNHNESLYNALIASREKEFTDLFGASSLNYNDNSARLLHLLPAIQESNEQELVAYIKSISPREISFLLKNPIDSYVKLQAILANFHDPLLFKNFNEKWYIYSSGTFSELSIELSPLIESAISNKFFFDSHEENGLIYYKFSTGDIFKLNIQTGDLILGEWKAVKDSSNVHKKLLILEQDRFITNLDKSVLDREHNILWKFDASTQEWTERPLKTFVLDNRLIQSKWAWQHSVMTHNYPLQNFLAQKITLQAIFGKIK